MSKNSNIEWTTHTFNGWIGCTKVSPGCANCYAEEMDRRRFSKTLPGGSHWGAGAPRHRTSAANWNQPLKWNREAAASGIRPRVFCSSLADWLDDEVPVEWLADLLDLIRRTPHLDWLLLTKRPQNWQHRLDRLRSERLSTPEHRTVCRDMVIPWLSGYVSPNIWIGTTVEDQTRADQRIPELLKIPARVRFLSCEPLLGPVTLSERRGDGEEYSWLRQTFYDPASPTRMRHEPPRIHWVICGGESGPQARPMHPDWARSLRDQCADEEVPFFFKQWGEFREVDDGKMGLSHTMVTTEAHAAAVLADVSNPHWVDDAGSHFSNLADLPDGVACRLLDRVGKKAAGRLLDGVEHSAFPEGGAR